MIYNIESKPDEWRIGQTIFNFLEWLHEEKEMPINQNFRMADPFHISDADFEQYFEDFLEWLDAKEN